MDHKTKLMLAYEIYWVWSAKESLKHSYIEHFPARLNELELKIDVLWSRIEKMVEGVREEEERIQTENQKDDGDVILIVTPPVRVPYRTKKETRLEFRRVRGKKGNKDKI